MTWQTLVIYNMEHTYTIQISENWQSIQELSKLYNLLWSQKKLLDTINNNSWFGERMLKSSWNRKYKWKEKGNEKENNKTLLLLSLLIQLQGLIVATKKVYPEFPMTWTTKKDYYCLKWRCVTSENSYWLNYGGFNNFFSLILLSL